MVLYYDIQLSGASAANIEFHHFSMFKSHSVSQWPGIPTICDDTEMARYAVVCSTSLWGGGFRNVLMHDFATFKIH